MQCGMIFFTYYPTKGYNDTKWCGNLNLASMWSLIAPAYLIFSQTY